MVKKLTPAIEETEEVTSNKYFYIILAVIVVAFISFIAYQKLTASQPPKTIEDLHKLNLAGALASEQGYTHNGYSFVLFDGLWYTKIQLGDVAYSIPLHFGPRETENVKISGTLSRSFDQSTDIYIVLDPLSSDSDYGALGASELAQNMIQAINKRPVGACDKNETVMCSDRPIVTCETTTKPAIYLLQEPGPEVKFKNNCIVLRGIKYDLVKAVDALLLKWYRIT